MLRILSLVLVFLLTSFAYADCNFKTGQYINELKDPSNIQLIEINVNKSAKYVKIFGKFFYQIQIPYLITLRKNLKPTYP